MSVRIRIAVLYALTVPLVGIAVLAIHLVGAFLGGLIGGFFLAVLLFAILETVSRPR